MSICRSISLSKKINEHVKNEEYAVTRKRSSVDGWTTIDDDIEQSIKRLKNSSAR